jgi:anti-sigma regulatory factor (Ser/Thr protein kinase)
VARAPDIELTLPARAENISVVRHTVGALADALPIDPQRIADIRLAVTEACTNVVVHAYVDREEGPMQFAATVDADEVMIVVRDEGGGITPRADSPGLGLGLPLIAALAENVELGHDELDRTEVRMIFPFSAASGSSLHDIESA